MWVPSWGGYRKSWADIILVIEKRGDGTSMPQFVCQRVAVYSRKSRFTGKGESIENQIELCRRFVREQYGEESAEQLVVYEDEGFSGGNLERPRFKLMMADARRKRFAMIVVYRLDRISRNIGDFAKLIEELSQLEIAFVSIKEQFDTTSPMGRAMMYIASVFSQLERETIAERIRDNMHELAKTGRWLGGVTPTGYASEAVSKVTVDGKIKKACRLKTVPEEAALVRLIFAKYLEADSLTKTDTFLLQNGFTSKNGLSFTRFTIRGILTNPVYMTADGDAFRYLSENNADLFSQEDAFDGQHGIMAYNRTFQKSGKANQTRPIDEWIVSVGAHEGLVSGKDWVKVQRLLTRNCAKAYRKPKNSTALLSGLLFCGACGDYMRPKSTNRFDAQGERVYTYLCETKERSRLQCCSSKNINGNSLDRAVIQEIATLGEDKCVFINELEHSKKLLEEDSAGSGGGEASCLRRSLEDNEKEITALISTLGKATGSQAEAYIIQRIEELHCQNLSISLRLDKLSALAAVAEPTLTQLSQVLSCFGGALDEAGSIFMREAIKNFVKKIVWDGREVHLYL